MDHFLWGANEPQWKANFGEEGRGRLKENIKFTKVEEILARKTQLWFFWGLVITAWEVWTMNTHRHTSRPLEECFVGINGQRREREFRLWKMGMGHGYFKNIESLLKNKHQIASITGIQPSTPLRMTSRWLANSRFQPERVGGKFETSRFPWMRVLLQTSQVATCIKVF